MKMITLIQQQVVFLSDIFRLCYGPYYRSIIGFRNTVICNEFMIHNNLRVFNDSLIRISNTCYDYYYYYF